MHRPCVKSLCRTVAATRFPRMQATHGFTLVELMVVITVMLILVTMTVVAVDFSFKSERVRSAARQMQSALEGARDRAIFAREPRGLRLLVDPTEPRMVTSLVYIGATKDWPLNPNEEHVTLERPDFSPQDNVADFPEVRIVRGDPNNCAWYTLKERGYLGIYEDLNFNGVLDTGEDSPPIGNGNGLLDRDAPRIKIPADDDGTWFTVLTHRLTASNPILEIIGQFPGTSGLTDATRVPAFDGNRRFTYKLELPPRILADAQPILLPEGIVIDLDASFVPSAWRPGAPPGMPPYPSMPLDRQYAQPYSPHMDIMFSPRGVVTGPLAAQGLVHLYLAERKDVVFAVDQGVMVPPQSGNPFTRRPPRFAGDAPLVPGANQFGINPEDPIGQRILTSIFTQTGKVSTHQIDATDANNDGYADAPFRFAAQGEGQSQ